MIFRRLFCETIALVSPLGLSLIVEAAWLEELEQLVLAGLALFAHTGAACCNVEGKGELQRWRDEVESEVDEEKACTCRSRAEGELRRREFGHSTDGILQSP